MLRLRTHNMLLADQIKKVAGFSLFGSCYFSCSQIDSRDTQGA